MVGSESFGAVCASAITEAVLGGYIQANTQANTCYVQTRLINQLGSIKLPGISTAHFPTLRGLILLTVKAVLDGCSSEVEADTQNVDNEQATLGSFLVTIRSSPLIRSSCADTFQ